MGARSSPAPLADIDSVRFNRYVAPPKEGLALGDGYKRRARGEEAAAAPKRKEPFDLYRSIWRPRTKWADSRDLYDTDAVRQKRFEGDWKRMLALGVIKYIMRFDDDALADEDGDGIPDEVEEVGEALLRNYDLCCAVFWYYASLSSEIDFMTLNAYTKLCTDCKLPSKKSKACRQCDIDTIFIAIDKSDARAAKHDPHAHDDGQQHREKALDRVEFMVAMLRIAIGKYILSGEMDDVSDALNRLLWVNLQACIGAEVLALPDDFRRRHAYTEEVCSTLKQHEAQVRA